MKTTEDLAREAGIQTELWCMGAASCVYTEGCHGVARGHLERFAALVRAQALEEAAQVCDQRAKDAGYVEPETEAEHCAAAIRALATPPNSVECIQAPEGTQCFQHYTNLGPGGLKAP